MSRRWTWRAARVRAVEILREEGVTSLWFKILGETVYRRVILMERRLDESVPEAVTSAPVVIELLLPTDVEEYRRFRPGTDVAEIQRRLALGHWCFVARCNGRIVHAGWAAARHARIEVLERDVTLAPGDIYQYESFTTPELRGRNVAAVRLTAMARHLRQAGYRRLIAAVVPENLRAFRPLQKAGYQPFGFVGVVRVGRRRRTFYRECRHVRSRHVRSP